MSTPILIHGACGRMGREVARAADADPCIALTGAVDRSPADCLRALAGLEGEPLPVTTDVAAAVAALPAGGVVIDFSTAGAVAPLASACAVHGRALLTCTTGVDAADAAAIEAACASAAVLQASNTSLGVNVLFDLARRAARALEGADIEVVEMHHRHKVDAPSGTALSLARAIADGLERPLDEMAIYGREGRYEGGRPPGELAIHTLRGGDVAGDHTAIFALEGERLELTHKASSRATFARGSMRIARFLARQPAGRYTTAQALGL